MDLVLHLHRLDRQEALARLDLVQNSRGLEGSRPSLDRLGGASWVRTKARVRKSMQEMAGELLKLYAAREIANGHAFAGEDPWQQEFEASFPYVETDDQVRAIHQLHASRWEARHQLRKSLREARRSLRDLVFTGADDAAIQAKTAEVQQLVAQGVQMRVEGLRAMSQILTPEQRDKLRQRRPTWH